MRESILALAGCRFVPTTTDFAAGPISTTSYDISNRPLLAACPAASSGCFDSNGNLKADGVHTFTYDQEGERQPSHTARDAIRPVYPVETGIGIAAAGVAGELRLLPARSVGSF